MNNSNELYNQSLALLNGDGVQKNDGASFELNVKAAEYGHHDALLAMGWYYLNGVGVEECISQAEYWYKKSAKQKEPRAMFSLGQINYYLKNFSESYKWFCRAEKLGHNRSIYWQAKLYWRGHGVECNKNRAIKLFNIAASKKVKEAQRVIRWINKNA